VAGGARLLDVHRDADHHRSVFTLAAAAGALAAGVLAGAREAVARVDMSDHQGVHPCIGALDVAPIVYTHPSARGAACVEALVLGDELARELELPVLLYGELAGGRTRAEIRRGGAEQLAQRIQAGEIAPDFGPRGLHPSAGATLVATRPPLVAFNLRLEPSATHAQARDIAARIREGGPDGLPGVRAIGLWLESAQAAQLSLNIEDPTNTPLAQVVEAVRLHAPVAQAELVGLAPRAAFEGFPTDLPIPGFDPARHLIENALA
jgi:glutamate formiminotransferase